MLVEAENRESIIDFLYYSNKEYLSNITFGFVVFFANGIIIFSTATLYAVGLKAENPDAWGGTPALFGFYRFFLIPKVRYSVMLL